MSNILSWLQKEEAEVLKAFGDIGPWLKQVVLPVAIQGVNIFKGLETAVDTDKTDIVGKIIDGTAGAAIEDTVRAALDKIVPELTLAQQFLSLGNTEAILQAVANELPNVTANTRALFLAEFAAQLGAVLAGGSVTVQNVWSLIQWYYSNNPTTVASTPASTVPQPAKS